MGTLTEETPEYKVLFCVRGEVEFSFIFFNKYGLLIVLIRKMTRMPNTA